MVKVFVFVIVALALVASIIEAATTFPTKSKGHENNVQKSTIVALKAASKDPPPALSFYDEGELAGDDESGDDDDGYVNDEQEVKVKPGKKHSPRDDATKENSLKWVTETTTERVPPPQAKAGQERDTTPSFQYKIAPHMADRPPIESFIVLAIMAAVTVTAAIVFLVIRHWSMDWKYEPGWKKLKSFRFNIVEHFQRRSAQSDRDDAEGLQEVTQSVRYMNFHNDENEEVKAEEEEEEEENLCSPFAEM